MMLRIAFECIPRAGTAVHFMGIRHARLVMAVLFLMSESGSLFAQGSYPTVIGASGQPYGPTQAEYQYRQRYGHPSPGSNGNGMAYVNGYPSGSSGGFFFGGYNPYLYMDIGPYVAPPSSGYVYYPSTAYYGVYGSTNYGFPTPQPYLSQPSPQMMFPLDPSQGNVTSNGSATITHYPTITNPAPIIQPSTPKAVESSFEFQTQGDLQLQQLNYMAASERYRKAIDVARDRADPRYRMALTLAARSRFSEAVDQLKLAGQLDPTWPQHASTLTQLFGEQNQFEKTRVKQRIAEWTLQDARDPNRLMLLGAVLYMDDDPNAKTMIDTAILLTGQQPWLTAFQAPRVSPAEPALAGKAPAGNGVQVPKPAGNSPSPPAPHPPQIQPPATPLPQSPIPDAPVPGSGAKLPVIPQIPIPAIPPLPEGTTSSLDPHVQPILPAPAGENESDPILPPLP